MSKIVNPDDKALFARAYVADIEHSARDTTEAATDSAYGAAPFLLAGFGLVLLFAGDSDEDDSSWPSESQSEDERDGLSGTLGGLGFLVVGAGVYGLLGGDWESLRDYPIWVDFDAPPDAGGQPAPPGSAGDGE